MSFAVLVDDVLACLAREHPAAEATMRRELGQIRIEATIDGERVSIGPRRSLSLVRIRAGVDVLCAVLLGEVAIYEAVLDDRIEVIGAHEDLIAASTGLLRFIEGAMRCVSVRVHVDQLLKLREEGRRAEKEGDRVRSRRRGPHRSTRAGNPRLRREGDRP